MTDTDRLDLEPGLVTAAAVSEAAGEFCSILFGDDIDVAGPEPAFFTDLNLDQVVESVVAGRNEYELTPFFYTPLRDVDAVAYRHEVFRDLETNAVRMAVRAFAGEMQQVRRYLTLAKKQHYKYEKERWFLDAAAAYCTAVSALRDALTDLELGSHGFRLLRDHLTTYTSSERFTSMMSEARSVLEGLGRVQYTLRIKGARVTVSSYREERDYSVEVEETFARFRQGAVEDHLVKIPDSGSMDHVEARIAQLVAPTVSVRAKHVTVEDGFDIALAAKLASDHGTVVRNDFVLRERERILVVTGPNQGGKTTFARMFGQLHYLAALGVPVPAQRARLFLPDRLFTHFEKEEDIRTLRGKLDDELVRVREILEQASGESIVILNEIFASTTLNDALCLGTEMLKRIADLGCLAVCVTFVDELASLNEATVSMVAAVAPDDPSQRTFKIVRRPADGRAYAWALADKYGLSYERLRNRISR